MKRSQATQGVIAEIGDRIKRARIAAGLTQEAAAARAGIDHKRWQRLEQGQVNTTIRTLVRVAEAVETTFWDLLAPSSAEVPAARKGRRAK